MHTLSQSLMTVFAVLFVLYQVAFIAPLFFMRCLDSQLTHKLLTDAHAVQHECYDPRRQVRRDEIPAVHQPS